MGEDVLATGELGSVSLDLGPEVGRADGVVVHRRPQALSQLHKLCHKKRGDVAFGFIITYCLDGRSFNRIEGTPSTLTL